MSLVSSAGERVERVWPTDSLTDNMSASFLGSGSIPTGPRTNDERRLANLVEEFLNGLADALHAGDVPYRQIRMGDVPTFCRDLMVSDPVFHLGTVNSWPAFPKRKENVHFVGDLRHEVLDVGVPVAVVGSGEEQLRVVVQKHETHVVDCANSIRVVKVAVPQLQQGAQSGGPAWCDRGDHGQFRDLALTAAGPTGAFHP